MFFSNKVEVFVIWVKKTISGIENPNNNEKIEIFFFGIKKLNLRAKYICRPIKDINEINYYINCFKIKHKMPYMDKKDLRNKIEQLYSEALEIEDSTLIIGLDAVKSILGTDLNNIDSKLLNWYIEQKPSSGKAIEYDKFDAPIPEAISFFTLESSLLEKDYTESLESVYYLSRVSEGKQILEFLLEFALKYTSNEYREIWHILRLQTFLNRRNMIRSLNRCVKLIVESDYNINITDKPIVDLNWLDYLSLKSDDINDYLLLYCIYNADLIRGESINRIISHRMSMINLSMFKKINKIQTTIEQSEVGRKWILNFINNNSNLTFDTLEFLNNIRGALIVSNPSNEKYIWTQLNNRICN